MVEVIIKKFKRKEAHSFKRHLEEEHPEVRGKIKIKNASRHKRKRKVIGNTKVINRIKRESVIAANPKTSL